MMTIGVVGRKCGMTRVFMDDGAAVPVTVVQVEPNVITQIKTIDSDGYNAIQITTGSKKRSRVTKPMLGQFAKANVEPGRGLWEFRLEELGEDHQVGKEINVGLFEVGQKVDVSGTSKGKGFAGVIKRYNFAMQDATHGNSVSHRAPGSIGQNQTPGRVFKGKKMAGQMGNVRKTVQTLEIVQIDAEKGLLMIKGGLPGAINGNLIVKPAVKVAQGGKS